MSQNFVDNAELSRKTFSSYTEERKHLLVDAIGDMRVEKVLDVGCGAGQQMLPFAVKKNALCFGIDSAAEVGKIGGNTFQEHGLVKAGIFLNAKGENIPFANGSFDVVLCMLALPYMDNRKALAEISRVLRPGGVLFLKTHQAMFHFGMLRERFFTFNPKQIAYPLICLFAGTFSLVAGRQLSGGIWEGKEVYQTDGFLKRQFERVGLKIVKMLPDSSYKNRSYLLEKI